MFNNLLLKALNHEIVPRPPIWLMRQAGRYLPEYQKIRSEISFLELCNNPELAAEVSLQPYKRFNTDAVIVFSDILLPAQRMGLELEFTEEGPKINNLISSEKDIKKLQIPLANEENYPTLTAINILKKEIGKKVPIIGFSGAPWTLFCYMTEGYSSNNFNCTKQFLYSSPKLAHELLSKITNTLFLYLTMQVNSGASVLQIFDTWAGVLSLDDYKTFALPYLKHLLSDLMPLKTPIILYSNNSNHLLPKISMLKVAALSLDWRSNLQEIRDSYGSSIGIQGNLDPAALLTDQTIVREKTKNMIQSIKNWQTGYICNLGHGVLPVTPVENVHAMIDTVFEFANEPVMAL
ncbi:MAG: uroporphyrinogen decarboxylase [Candidatus Melainabacteria bacterium]|nr:uroporphyrinogen decarboxylase [Candidatus Melainabacteria bacterium]